MLQFRPFTLQLALTLYNLAFNIIGNCLMYVHHRVLPLFGSFVRHRQRIILSIPENHIKSLIEIASMSL